MMNNDMQVITEKNHGDLIEFTNAQIDVIKRSKAPTLTDVEFMTFMSVAKRRGLDPLLNQIHAIKRNTKNGGVVTLQVGVDGFRIIAARTDEYAGNDNPSFSFSDNKRHPDSATVTVYRLVKGEKYGFTATAYWDEYYPGDDNKQAFMWRKMPKGQLSKCAECLALRKGFPGDLAGLYGDDEMHQAGNNAILVSTKAEEIKKLIEEPKPEAKTSDTTNESPKMVTSSPMCCGTPMSVSKYVDKELGHKPWFCYTCKAKLPKEG